MAKRASATEPSGSEKKERLRKELGSTISKVLGIFEGDVAANAQAKALREEFLKGLEKAMQGGPGNYVETIQGLPVDVSLIGTKWLESIVADCCKTASAAMTGLKLFQNQQR
jgi:hypothetical protein